MEELNFEKDSDDEKKRKISTVPDRSVNEFDLNKSLEERIQILYQSPNA